METTRPIQLLPGTLRRWAKNSNSIKRLWESKAVAGAFLIIGVFIIVAMFMAWFERIEDYFINAVTELLGIGAGVFLIDRLRIYDQKKNFQKSLVRQARSHSNAIALDAIETLRQEGWLNRSHPLQLLSKADLSGGDLADASFKDALLNEAKFTKSKLDRTNFELANLSSAIMAGASLKNTNFCGTQLGSVNFTGANLVECLFQNGEAEHPCADFSTPANQNVNFTDATIIGKSQNTNTRRNRIRRDFAGIDSLNGAIFQRATIRDISFADTSLKRCVFAEADLEGTDFTRADLTQAIFYLDGARTVIKEKSRTIFDDAILISACMKQCTFIGTSFVGADLSNAEVDDVNFGGGCDFSAATLIKLNGRPVFNGVTFNYETKFIDDLTLGSWHENIWQSVVSEFPDYDPASRKAETTQRFRTEVENAARNAGIAISANIMLQEYDEEDVLVGQDEASELIYEPRRKVYAQEFSVPITVSVSPILSPPRQTASKLPISVDDAE